MLPEEHQQELRAAHLPAGGLDLLEVFLADVGHKAGIGLLIVAALDRRGCVRHYFFSLISTAMFRHSAMPASKVAAVSSQSNPCRMPLTMLLASDSAKTASVNIFILRILQMGGIIAFDGEGFRPPFCSALEDFSQCQQDLNNAGQY